LPCPRLTLSPRHPAYSINGILGIPQPAAADANDNLLKRKRDEEPESEAEAEYKRARSQQQAYLQQAVWAGKWATQQGGPVKQEKVAGSQEAEPGAPPYTAGAFTEPGAFPGYEAAMGQYSSASPTQGSGPSQGDRPPRPRTL
jgi:hypothetical protein